MGKWITNLESKERVEQAVITAQAVYESAKGTPNERVAKAALDTAKFIRKDVAKAMAEIEREYGRVTIGKPKGTEFKSAEAIEADGHIGIYREGAGN